MTQVAENILSTQMKSATVMLKERRAHLLLSVLSKKRFSTAEKLPTGRSTYLYLTAPLSSSSSSCECATNRAQAFEFLLSSIPKSSVFLRGLSIVAALAQRLPVFLIPKQFPITFVRDDMVNNDRRSQPAVAFAFFAKRMNHEEC